MNNRNWIKYLITCVVLAVVGVLIMVYRQLFTQTEMSEIMKILSDSFVVPGMISLCAGLLIVCTNGGTFDMMAYGMKSFFSLFTKDTTKRKHRTFYDYRQEQMGKKRSFVFLLIIGGAFLLIGLVFFALFYVYR